MGSFRAAFGLLESLKMKVSIIQLVSIAMVYFSYVGAQCELKLQSRLILARHSSTHVGVDESGSFITNPEDIDGRAVDAPCVSDTWLSHSQCTKTHLRAIIDR